MKGIIKYIGAILLLATSVRADGVFEQAEAMKSAMVKLQEIKNNATWKDGDEWFFTRVSGYKSNSISWLDFEGSQV